MLSIFKNAADKFFESEIIINFITARLLFRHSLQIKVNYFTN